jgi:hypothetical protein
MLGRNSRVELTYTFRDSSRSRGSMVLGQENSVGDWDPPSSLSAVAGDEAALS